MDTLELLAHPVRLRIVHAMRGERELTTGQLCARIPDTSKAMVYRHVDLLAAGGILEVAGERRVRGAVERRYRLRHDRAVLDADALTAMTPDDHRRAFATSMAVLVAEFNAYLDREGADPVADLIGYRQHAVWLTRGELEEMIIELRRVILPLLTNQPTPDRTQHLLSPIFFPVEQPPTDSEPGPDRPAPRT
ncbi:helix-turn-helix domain-containing protein [Nonomuraea sp. LP-02]|uniref:helix-turn-helix domain-containing protein n=1 Tax=Nonomuraea sp. LP-02 TaxID=3097960 RepID=UPI002E380EB9|nr:helix-turn-helix domain-containing protein [Nonomuraea sp. LP-02]MED7931321.1 helix-turn-helix domain-containing protein [Nonomuraea sp. LP-02]